MKERKCGPVVRHSRKERGTKEKNKNKNKEGRRETRKYEGNGGEEGSKRDPPRKTISKCRALARTHTFLDRTAHPCGS